MGAALLGHDHAKIAKALKLLAPTLSVRDGRLEVVVFGGGSGRIERHAHMIA